jgi:hypothetical protein
MRVAFVFQVRVARNLLPNVLTGAVDIASLLSEADRSQILQFKSTVHSDLNANYHGTCTPVDPNQQS